MVRLVRLLVPVLALALALSAAAPAAGAVRQAGKTSQKRGVSLKMASARLSLAISWKARCPGNTYSGRSQVDRVPVRRGGRFSSTLRYSHRLGGRRTARVTVSLSGRARRGRASGTWRGVVKVSGVGTCRSGRVAWSTRRR